MSITKKILAGLGVVALTAGSLIGTPAKAQAESVGQEKLFKAAQYAAVGICFAKQGRTPFKELEGRMYSEKDVVLTAMQEAGIWFPTNLSEEEESIFVHYQRRAMDKIKARCVPQATTTVTNAPAQNTGESILSDHFRRLDCTIAGQCGGRRVEYTPRQRAWMNCKETFKYQDAHKICGGFPLR